MSESTGRSVGWVFPVVLGVVVVGLVAIALSRRPAQLDPDTPEGTVQEYLLAVDEQRYEDALAVLHPGIGEVCQPEDLRQSSPPDFTARLGHSSDRFGDVGIVSTEEVPGRQLPAGTDFVEVTITRDDGGGFGSGWDEYVVFELAQDDDFYWIVGEPWPYFTWNCSGF